MSDAVAAPAPVPVPAKKATKPRKPTKPATHPKYSIMIAAAVATLKERGGSSRQAILKYIMANYKLGNEVTKINAHLKTGLKAGVEARTLKQVKGTGASGSFRLGENTVVIDVGVDDAKKVKKPKTAKKATKKPKSPAKKNAAAKPKKAASAKKPKSPAKKPAAAKPKKAAKPKTASKKAAKPKTASKKSAAAKK